MNKLDKIGEHVKTRIEQLKANEKDVETTRLDVQADLRKVWDALEKKQSVNGCTTKKEWAEKFAEITTRYCQYILRDGSRRRTRKQEGTDANHVVRFANLDRSQGIIIGGHKYLIKNKALNTVGDAFTVKIEPYEKDAEPAKPLQPKPSKVKKLTAGETAEAIRAFTATYKIDRTDSQQKPEWVEPYRAAFEAEAANHPEWRNQQVETEMHRIETMLHARKVIAAENKQLETHEMKGSLRTWCGKTPGVNVPADSIVPENATCKQCQMQKKMGKAREEQKPLSEPAEALVAAADLEKTLDAMEPITVLGDAPKECDYSEDEVAAMFAGGGK